MVAWRALRVWQRGADDRRLKRRPWLHTYEDVKWAEAQGLSPKDVNMDWHSDVGDDHPLRYAGDWYESDWRDRKPHPRHQWETYQPVDLDRATDEM